MAHEDSAQVQEAPRSGLRPEHAGLLQALADDGLAAGLNDAAAVKKTLFVVGQI